MSAQIVQQLLLHPFNCFFSRTTWVRRYQKGKTSLDLNEARDDGVLGCSDISWAIMQAICTSLQTDSHTNTPPVNFYRPYALPDAQPTVSQHRRHKLYKLKKIQLSCMSVDYYCIYTVSQKKNKPLAHNFTKYWPIFKILSLLDSVGNL